MRYRLRTLLILLAVLPPILAPLGVWGWRQFVEWRAARLNPAAPGTGYLGLVADETPVFGQGVWVQTVRKGAPSERGGLRDGDIITDINNQACLGLSDLDLVLSQSTIGSKLTMKVMRDGKPQTVVVILSNPPPRPPQAPAP